MLLRECNGSSESRKIGPPSRIAFGAATRANGTVAIAARNSRLVVVKV